MLVSKAYAQAVEITSTAASVTPPTPMESVVWNMGVVVVLVVLFYFMLIRPQQRRFREHSQMLAGLKKGDKVVTGGGLIGTIEKITEGEQEVIVDLGNGLKVTAVRSTLQGAGSVLLKPAGANAGAAKPSNDGAPAKKAAKGDAAKSDAKTDAPKSAKKK